MKANQHAGEQENSRDKVSDEAIMKITKEIVVKFIEMGKITPAGFDLSFRNIHRAIHKTVRNDNND